LQHLDGYELENRAEAILTGLGIGKDRFNLPVESFSGGWKMRIALAPILLPGPGRLPYGRAHQPPGPGVHRVAGGMAGVVQGTPSTRRERVMRREQLIASQKRQAAMLAKEEEFIARFGARASHAAQVQSRVKTIEKIERIVIPPDPKEMKVRFAPVARSGDIVAKMEDLSET
jgi:ATP-binding cassette subfamily F protein 3